MRRSVAVLAAAALVHAPAAAGWAWPVDGPVLRPFVLGNDPYAAGQHRGIDIGASPGTTVRAAASGTVSFVGTVPVGGRTVAVRTPDGLSVTYLELGAALVATGAEVSEGDRIATIGSVSHVHLGVRVTADPHGYLDPLAFLPARPPVPARDDPVETAPAVVVQPGPVVTPDAVEPTVATQSAKKAESEPVMTTPTPKPPTTPKVAPAAAEPAVTAAPPPRKAEQAPTPAANSPAQGIVESTPAPVSAAGLQLEPAPEPGGEGDADRRASPAFDAPAVTLPALPAHAAPSPAGKVLPRPSRAAVVDVLPLPVETRPPKASTGPVPGGTRGEVESHREPMGVSPAPKSEREAANPSVTPLAFVGLLALGLLGAVAKTRRRHRPGASAHALDLPQVARCPLVRMRPPRLIHACARAEEPGWLMPRAGRRQPEAPHRPLPRPRRRVLAGTRG
jgi:hypothetical protein